MRSRYSIHRRLGPIVTGQTPSQIGAWAVIQAGITAKLHSSDNVASLTDNGAGDFTLTYSTAFASASDYVVLGNPTTTSTGGFWTAEDVPPLAGSCRVLTIDAGNALVDRDPTQVICIGRM